MQSFFIKTASGRKEIFAPNMALVEKHDPKHNSPEKVSTGTAMFEPKVLNRFIVYITDKNGETLIPSFIIKKTDRPTFRYNWFGFRKSNPLTMELYDPIVPSGMGSVLSAINSGTRKWNIVIKLLGPVGDVVEEWHIPKAKLKSINTSPMNWSSESDPVTISMTFDIGKFRGIQF